MPPPACPARSGPPTPADDRRRPGDAADAAARVARRPAAPAADHRLDPRSRWPPGLLRRAQRRLRQAREQRRQREQAAPAGRVPRVLPGLPPARPALGDPAQGRRVPRRGQGLDRDPVPVVDGQLPRPGQARRRVPRVPAQDQRRRVAGSRTFGTVFIERILDMFTIALLGIAAGFWSFRTGCRRRSSSWSVVGSRSSSCSPSPCSPAQLRPARSSALPLPQRVVEFYDRFEQGVFGALSRRQLGRSSSSASRSG